MSELTDNDRGESFRKWRGTTKAYKIPSVISFILEPKGLIKIFSFIIIIIIEVRKRIES